MRTPKAVIVGAALVLWAAVSIAQTVVVTNPVPGGITSTNGYKPTGMDRILAQVGSVENFSADVYGTWAPDAPDKWGGGGLLVYNLNPQDTFRVGIGIGLDWLGHLSLVSGDVTLQAPFHPWPSRLPGWTVTPLGVAGIAKAYSGGSKFDGPVSAVTDAGIGTEFGHLFGGRFNAGFLWGRWVGSGPYDVDRYHAFVGYSLGF